MIDTDKVSQKKLSRLVSMLLPGAEIVMFSNMEEFSVLGRKSGWDIAFLETEIGAYSGISLALDIKRYSPRCNIIFVTSFPQHSLEAFKARPSGFVVKPFDEKEITLELEDLRYPIGRTVLQQKKLRVMTFGSFAVYTGSGKPMHFSRTLAKEIFAYLIDQCGYPVTSRDIAVDVLGESVFDDTVSKRVSKAVRYLISDLRNEGSEDVIDKQNRQIRINKNRLSCDLYDALDGSNEALMGYNGNYMSEYSWSETSFAMELLRTEMAELRKKLNFV